jgi:proline racemase
LEFRAWIDELTEAHGRPTVVPAMTGTAYPVGACRFTVDLRDPLLLGFLLR